MTLLRDTFLVFCTGTSNNCSRFEVGQAIPSRFEDAFAGKAEKKDDAFPWTVYDYAPDNRNQYFLHTSFPGQCLNIVKWNGTNCQSPSSVDTRFKLIALDGRMH